MSLKITSLFLPQGKLFCFIEFYFFRIFIILTFLDLDALCLEKMPEPADLLLQLSYQLGVAVLVHNSLADNLFRSKFK